MRYEIKPWWVHRITEFFRLNPKDFKFFVCQANPSFREVGKPIMIGFADAAFKVKDEVTTITQFVSISIPIEDAREFAARIISCCDQQETWKWE